MACARANVSEYESDTTLSSLNDDSLRCIFEHLSIKEKVGIVRVSKKCQQVIRDLMDFNEEKICIKHEGEGRMLNKQFFITATFAFLAVIASGMSTRSFVKSAI